MDQEITNRTHVLVTRNGNVHYVTEEDANALIQMRANTIEDTRDVFIQFNSLPGVQLINSWVVEIMPATAYEDTLRRRRGEWLDRVCGEWHGKGETCAKAEKEKAKARKKVTKMVDILDGNEGSQINADALYEDQLKDENKRQYVQITTSKGDQWATIEYAKERAKENKVSTSTKDKEGKVSK